MRLSCVVHHDDEGLPMRVQRVLMPGSGAESWTVLDDEHSLVEPVERFLGYLASIERSPNTIKAYAHDLKDWFVYLGGVGLDWREVSLEDVAGFVGWLRLPAGGPRWEGRGPANGGAPLQRVECEPQARGSDVFL